MNIQNSTTVNRLILLYLLNRMPYGIGHNTILGLNLDHEWMLYFDLEQQLLDLCDIGLAKAVLVDGEKHYHITAGGLEVIELYRRRIPLSIRTQIDTYVQLNAKSIASRMEISARYEQNSAVDYAVTLKLMDHFEPLLEMRVSAPSERDAKHICAQFEHQGALIYAQALGLLTREDTIDEDL